MQYAMPESLCNVGTSLGRCEMCGRPARLYGRLDIRTGWEGWCVVCNGRWHFDRVKKQLMGQAKGRVQCTSKKSVRAMTLKRASIMAAIMSFLGFADLELQRIQKVHLDAARKYWYRQFCLLRIRIVEPNGEVRGVDSDDEDPETGVCRSELTFTNIMWKLQLSPGPLDPFTEIVGMLTPPFTL